MIQPRLQVLARAYPSWSCFVLVALMPVSTALIVGPPLVAGVPPPPVTPALEVADLGAAIVLLAALVRGAPPWPPLGAWDGWSRVLVPLLGLAALALVTIPFALVPALAAYTALHWIIAAGVGWAVWRCRPAPEHVAIALVATLSLHVLLGLGQMVNRGPLGVPWELAMEIHRPGASVILTGDQVMLRPYGLTFHPNVLGGYLAVALVLGLPLLDRVYWRPVWWLLFLGLLSTFSRSAWLAAALMLPIAMLWLARRESRLRRPLAHTALGAALMLLLGGVLWHGQIVARLDPVLPRSLSAETRAALPHTELRSLDQRAELLEVGMRVFTAHPLTGVGGGNFPVAMSSTQTVHPPDQVHNVPLLLAAEVGFAGAALWLWLWLVPAGMAFRYAPSLDTWTLVLVCAALTVGIVSLFDHYPSALTAGRLLGVTVLGLLSQSPMVTRVTRESS
jgi:O-antigen ligase